MCGICRCCIWKPARAGGRGGYHRWGMMFDQFSTMARAAIHGLGVALLPTFFARPYLRDGQLVLAASQTTQSIGNYYLVWPEDRDETAALGSFRGWLAQQAEPATEK